MDFPKSVPGVGLVGGKFVDENQTTGQAGSLIPSAWGNAVTDEILNVIRAAGLEPNEGDVGQLEEAIAAIAGDGSNVKKTSDTGAAILPEGTTADRPVNPSGIPTNGFLMRWNTTTRRIEYFDRAANDWPSFGTAALLTATANTSDATTGRALRVGDFGIGQGVLVKDNISGAEPFGAYYDNTKPASFIFNIPYAPTTAGFRLSNIPYENRFFAQAAVEQNSQSLRTAVEFWHTGNFDVNKVFGLGQTWKDVTSSRLPGVVQTNVSAQPILIQIIGRSSSSAAQIELLINGAWVIFAEQGTTTGQTSTTLVMPGQSFRMMAIPVLVMELS